MNKLFIYFLLLTCMIGLSSCGVTKFIGYYASADDDKSGSLNGQVFQTDDTSYRIGTLPSTWKKNKVEGGDLAFTNSTINATLTVNSTCNEKKKNYSLRALSESLLIGIKGKEAVERQEMTVDGLQALRTIYTGRLNNVPIKIATVVLKKDICIYDFTYASSLQNFDLGIVDFNNFVSQFKAL